MSEQWDDLDLATESPDSAGGLDIWGILQRGKWIILAASILGVAAGYLYYSQADPVYQSAARILIERRRPALPLDAVEGSADRLSVFQEALKHPLVFTSPTIVSLAVENHDLASLSSFSEPGTNPVFAIIRNLGVAPADKGNAGPIFDVTLQGPDAKDLPQIITALIETYREFLELTHQDVNRDARDVIVQAKDELLDQLGKKEAEYNKFRSEAPMMWKDGAATNLHQDRQSDIEDERSQVMLQISELKSQLENALAIVESGENVNALKWVAQAAQQSEGQAAVAGAQTSTLLAHKSSLLPLLLEEHELRSRYGTDHPRVKSIERRISYMKDFYRDVLGQDLEHDFADANEVQNTEGDTEPGNEPYPRSQTIIDTYLASLSMQLDQLQQRLNHLDEMFQKEQAVSKEMAVYQARDENFRNEIARSQQLFEAVVKSLEEISLVKDYSGHNFPGSGTRWQRPQDRAQHGQDLCYGHVPRRPCRVRHRLPGRPGRSKLSQPGGDRQAARLAGRRPHSAVSRIGPRNRRLAIGTRVGERAQAAFAAVGSLPHRPHRTLFQFPWPPTPGHSGYQPDTGGWKVHTVGEPRHRDRQLGQIGTAPRRRFPQTDPT